MKKIKWKCGINLKPNFISISLYDCSADFIQQLRLISKEFELNCIDIKTKDKPLSVSTISFSGTRENIENFYDYLTVGDIFSYDGDILSLDEANLPESSDIQKALYSITPSNTPVSYASKTSDVYATRTVIKVSPTFTYQNQISNKIQDLFGKDGIKIQDLYCILLSTKDDFHISDTQRINPSKGYFAIISDIVYIEEFVALRLECIALEERRKFWNTRYKSILEDWQSSPVHISLCKLKPEDWYENKAIIFEHFKDLINTDIILDNEEMLLLEL